MLDETLHAAQTLSQREQAAALERTARALEAAAQYRGDDTAETTRHLSPGKRVLRVTRQPRVVHALDPGMPFQELRDGERSEERRVGKECRSRWPPYVNHNSWTTEPTQAG